MFYKTIACMRVAFLEALISAIFRFRHACAPDALDAGCDVFGSGGWLAGGGWSGSGGWSGRFSPS